MLITAGKPRKAKAFAKEAISTSYSQVNSTP